MSARHFLRFNVTGLLGIGVQLAAFAALLRITRLPPTANASFAVVMAVVHNFLWHWKWTWADRHIPLRAAPAAFARFVLGNGVVSIAGTAVLMPLLVSAGVAPLVANAAAMAITGLINFRIAGEVVFPGNPATRSRAGTYPIRITDPARPKEAHIWSHSDTYLIQRIGATHPPDEP